LSLRSLIRLLAADRLHWFAWYCSAVGLLTIVWQLWSV
jgi:undecaprenyl pyrophosphate phosphatase UppP